MFVDGRSDKHWTTSKGGSYQDRWNFMLSGFSMPPCKKSWSWAIEKGLAKIQIYKASTQTIVRIRKKICSFGQMLAFQIVCRKIRWAQNVMGVYEYDVFVNFGGHSPQISKIIGKNCWAQWISWQMQYITNFGRKSNHFTFQNCYEYGQFCRRICESARAKCNSSSTYQQKFCRRI